MDEQQNPDYNDKDTEEENRDFYNEESERNLNLEDQIPMNENISEKTESNEDNDADKNVKLALLDIMEEIGYPIDYEFIDKIGTIKSTTLNKIKILLLATKELKQFHTIIQNQLQSLRKTTDEYMKDPEELSLKLAQNLGKLQHARFQSLLSDLVSRFFWEEIEEAEIDQQSKENYSEIEQLDKLKEFVLSVDNLQAEITRYKEENNKLKQKIFQLEEKIANNTTQEKITPISLEIATEPVSNEILTNLQESIEQKNLRITQLEEEIQEKIRSIEGQRHEVENMSQLREERDKNNEEIINLKEQLQNSTTEYDILKEENHIFQNRVNQLESDLDQRINQISEIESRNSEYEKHENEFHQMSNDLERVTEEKHEFQAKLSDLLEKMDRQEESIQDQQNSIRLLTEDLDHANKQLDIKISQIDELSLEIKLKNEDIANLRNQFSEKSDDNDSMGNFEKKLSEKELLITDLQEEIRNYEEKLANMVHRDELSQMKSEISNLENQLEEKSNKIQQKQEELVNLRGEFSDKQIDYQKQIDELKEHLKSREEMEALIQEKEEALKDYERQEEEFHDALLDKVRLTAEKEEMNEKINELVEQKRVLFERISSMGNQNKGHLAIIERLKEQNVHLEAQLEESNIDSKESLKEQVEREFLQNQIDRLNSELRQQIALASEAKGKYEIIKDQFDQIQLKLDKLNSDYNSLEQKYNIENRRNAEEISQLKDKLSQKSVDFSKMKKQITILKEQLESTVDGEEYKEKIQSLHRDLTEQQQIAESIADDVSRKELTIEKLNGENTRLNEELVQLKRRIKVLRRELAHK